jgi:hypothetical protein
MECVRARTVVPFINHRRETQGYEKQTNTHTDYFGKPYTSNSIVKLGSD